MAQSIKHQGGTARAVAWHKEAGSNFLHPLHHPNPSRLTPKIQEPRLRAPGLVCSPPHCYFASRGGPRKAASHRHTDLRSRPGMLPAPRAASLFRFSCWECRGPGRFEAACEPVWSQWSLICATACTVWPPSSVAGNAYAGPHPTPPTAFP